MANSGSKRLQGKVAIVTGAGRGIGRCEALLLAREGAKVVVNDLGGAASGEGADQSVAQSVVDEIRAAGGEAVANADSVTTMDGGRRIVDTALRAFGRLDILINNAGNLRPKRIWEMTEEDWDIVVDVHLKGHFIMTRHAAPVFREQRSGAIVNTASESGLGHYAMSAYSAAKEGIVGFTRTIARDLGEFNVRVNAIRPRASTRMGTPEALETIRYSQQVLGIPALGNDRLGEADEEIKPEQPAVLAVWLCTDAAANITGRTFQVHGHRVGLWSEPELIRNVYRPEEWDLDGLDSAAVRNYLTGDLKNPYTGLKK